ncbi:IL26 protein, partial [Psilopogon haemacephalus]|nr:IL26 protein [Psilopogon haemacephalus]
MKAPSALRAGRLLVLLCLVAAGGKKSPAGKQSCRRGLLSQVTENLYLKAASLKAAVPKDLIKNTRLLKKTTKMLFMTNCSIRDQLLSFYVKNVFSHLTGRSDKLYFITAFQALQANIKACVSMFVRAKLT